MKPLRVEFDLTREDLTAAVRVVLDHHPATRQAWRRVRRVILATAAFLVAVPILLNLHDPFTLAATGAGLLWLLWCWPGPRRMAAMARRQVAAQLATRAGRAYLGRRVVELSPDDLTVTTDYSAAAVAWHGVFDLITDRDYVYFVLAGPAYLAVPRRAFEFDGDFTRFAELAAELAGRGGGLAARAGREGGDGAP